MAEVKWEHTAIGTPIKPHGRSQTLKLNSDYHPLRNRLDTTQMIKSVSSKCVDGKLLEAAAVSSRGFASGDRECS